MTTERAVFVLVYLRNLLVQCSYGTSRGITLKPFIWRFACAEFLRFVVGPQSGIVNIQGAGVHSLTIIEWKIPATTIVGAVLGILSPSQRGNDGVGRLKQIKLLD